MKPTNTHNSANDDNGSIRGSSVAPSDGSDDILDTTTVNQWLATRPSNMSRAQSPPIYDSDHPDYEADSSNDEQEEEDETLA